MRFASSLSSATLFSRLRDELVAPIQETLQEAPDLALLFISGFDADVVNELAREVRDWLSPRVFLGCSCEGVVGGDREMEQRPAASLLAGTLPGVGIHPFRFTHAEAVQAMQDPVRLRAALSGSRPPRATLLVGDPFSTPIQELLRAITDAAPEVPVAGGMASGGYEPGANRLFLNSLVVPDGVVGVTLSGNIRLVPLVSQGCRPVGPHYLITSAAGNVIETLGDRPALEVMREMASGLSPDDLRLLQEGVFAGLVIEESADPFGRGDVLIRQVAQADAESGAVAVSDMVRAGQTVQFHVRDAAGADAELRRLLARQQRGIAPAAALVFTCNGRGTRLFPQPDHDAGLVNAAFPDLPSAGFIAMGEIGMVGGRPYLHSHTASIAFLLPDDSA